MSGCSSGVEHNLAKVGVGRSNRLTRSILPRRRKPRFAGAFVRFGAVEIVEQESGSERRGYRRVTRMLMHYTVGLSQLDIGR